MHEKGGAQQFPDQIKQQGALSEHPEVLFSPLLQQTACTSLTDVLKSWINMKSTLIDLLLKL